MVDGEVMPVSLFSCDHCTRPWIVEGSVFQAALGFAVDQHGNLFDPASGEPFGPEAN